MARQRYTPSFVERTGQAYGDRMEASGRDVEHDARDGADSRRSSTRARGRSSTCPSGVSTSSQSDVRTGSGPATDTARVVGIHEHEGALDGRPGHGLRRKGERQARASEPAPDVVAPEGAKRVACPLAPASMRVSPRATVPSSTRTSRPSLRGTAVHAHLEARAEHLRPSP